MRQKKGVSRYLSTETGPFCTKSCVNERAKLKESRQINREIRVQDDNITENSNIISPLTFRNLPKAVAYMQSQRTERKLNRRFTEAKIQ